MDKEGNEGPAAGSEGPKHLYDWGLECKAWASAYTSFCGFKHRRFISAFHQAAKEDQPPALTDRGDGQPLGPPQQDSQRRV